MSENLSDDKSNQILSMSFFILSLSIIGIIVVMHEYGIPFKKSDNLHQTLTLSQGKELTVVCDKQPLGVKEENGSVHISCGQPTPIQVQTNIEVPELKQGTKPTSIAPTSFFTATATPVATQTGIPITQTP